VSLILSYFYTSQGFANLDLCSTIQLRIAGMGVQGVWPFLKKHGIEGDPVDPKASDVPIHVDVLSIFRAYILATEYYILKSLFWKRLRAVRASYRDDDIMNDEYLDETRIQHLVRSLHNRLSQYFRQRNVTLHIDGKPTKQKAHARESRRQRKEESQAILDESLAKVRDLISQVSPTSIVTRSQKNKLVRHTRTALQLWKAARTLNGDAKEELASELRELGWTVCSCHGEADVCIAKQQGPVTVATTDSDFLFLGVDTVLRQDPQDKTVLRAFSIQDIVDAFGLTEETWTAVGVVSGNDQSKNVPGQGIATNVKTMQAIRTSENSTPKDILTSYCSLISRKTKSACDPTIFQYAYDVFFRRHEDLDDNPEMSGFFDYKILDMLIAAEGILEQFKRTRRSSTRALPGPMIVDTDVHMTTLSDPVDTDVHMTETQDDPPAGTSSRPIRPHKLLMSGHRYTVKTYTKTTEATPEPTTPSRKKASKKKKKKQNPPRAKFAPCSRGNRQDPLAKKSTDKQNKRGAMIIVQDKLSAKYMTMSMDCGTLSRRLYDGLRTNYSHLSTEQQAKLSNAIATTIKEMVYIGTETTRMILQAIACYLAKIMTENPTTRKEDTDERKRLFRQFDYFENNAFFSNMMTDLFCWHDQSKRRGRPRADSSANRCASEILDNYCAILGVAGKSVPDLKRRLHGGLGAFFQLTGQRIADIVQSHYRRNNLELLRRVKQFNEEWYFGEGRTIVEDVDREKGTSTMYGQVSLFWLLNSRLPPSKQLKYFPESDFTDQHFVITERALLDALLAGRKDLDIVKETFSGSHEVSDQPGDLVFKLFLSGQVDYAKTVCVVNPTVPANADFEQRGMLPLLNQTESEFEEQLDTFENASNLRDAKETFKNYLDKHLEDPREYKAKIDSGDRGIACRKNVLSGSISTNGHDLQVLAYSITNPKPKPGPAKKVANNKTRSKLPDVKEVLKTPDQVQCLDLDPDAYVVVGIDPGVRNTATATIMTSAEPDTYRNLTISQSSQCVTTKRYLHRLEQAKRKTMHWIPSRGQEANICELENSIQPVEPRQVNDSELLPVWQSLRTSIERHVISVMQVEELLREFYSSMMFKIKTRELKQAKTATSNKSIDKLLWATDILREEAGATRALVVVGDGSFTSHNGPTTHQKFISNLKKKVVTSVFELWT
jgi:5'-3' exonuclease